MVASGSQNNDEVDVYKTMIIVGSYVTQTASNYCNCTFKGLPSGLKRAKRSKVPIPRRHRYDASFVCARPSIQGVSVYSSVCMVCCSGYLDVDWLVLYSTLEVKEAAEKGSLLNCLVR